jgi:hypothetical protein
MPDKPELIGEGRMQRITSQADARWLKRQERKAKQQVQTENANG